MNSKTELAKKRNPIISEYLDIDPSIPHLTLAKIMHKEHPDLFKSIDAARNAVRARTGNNGEYKRKKLEKTHGQHYRQPFTGEALPVPTPFWDSTPFVFDSSKCLFMADIHIPFHEPDAIEVAVKHAKKAGCTDVLLDGDVLDHYQESVFVRVPDVSTLTQELKDGKQFLQWLRKKFPKGRIIYKEGNHEERFAIKAHRAIPEAGRLLDKFTYGPDGLDLDNLGIELIQDRRRIDMGYLTVIHGHELGRGTSVLVNPARTLQLRGKEIICCAHWHQPSQQRVRTIRQRHIGCWSIGCLCNLTPNYRPINDWELGFAVYERYDEEGGFVIDNKTIIKNMVV